MPQTLKEINKAKDNSEYKKGFLEGAGLTLAITVIALTTAWLANG